MTHGSDSTNTSRGGLNSARRRVETTNRGFQDYFLELAKFNIPGHDDFRKFGENPDIDTASGFEDIWDGGGTYVPPTQARIHDIVSTSALDAGTALSSGTATGGSLTTLEDTGATFVTDGVLAGDLVLNDDNMEIGIVTSLTETIITAAGGMRSPNTGLDGAENASGDAYRIVTNASTGASVFWLLGLDASFLEISEFVVLNGLSNVATVFSYIRQNRARVFGPNTTGAVGIITSTAQTDGTVSAQIIDGNNQTLMAIYTVPINQTGFLDNWWATLSKKQTTVSTVRLRAGVLDGISYPLQVRAVDNTGSSDFLHPWKVALPIPGGVDIWIEADANSNDVGVAGGFETILEDKPVV